MGRRPGTHQRVFSIAKKLDGSGVVGITASDWFVTKFKIANFPVPRDWANRPSGVRIKPWGRTAGGYNRWPGRISYSPDPGYQGVRDPTSRFCMASNSEVETWYVFAELLRVYYGEPFSLRNKFGNSCSSVGLTGSDFAYMPGTDLHAELCRFDLFPEPPPEHFLLRGRELPDPVLHLCSD